MSGIGKVVGKLFSSLMPDEPEIPEVKTAPVADDKTSMAAKLRKSQRDYGQTGRAGTMLTGSNKLG